jgi:glucosamine--fructose-6-phosphate aminotransferase (isomerizing)
VCGIIGYVGGRPCKELILGGLERLEYRGYDSAGIALLEPGEDGFATVRAVGNLSRLREAAGSDGSPRPTPTRTPTPPAVWWSR